MEQQTNGLIAFEELQSLPDILKANETSVTKARTAIQPLIDTFQGIDLATADPDETEAFDKQLADVQYKLGKTLEMMEDRRKPGTRRLDEIKKRFTALEADVKALQDQVNQGRNAWQSEKLRRQRAEEAARLAEIRAKEQSIEQTAAQQALIMKEQTFLINSTVERMITKYNSLPADGLDAYCDSIGLLKVEEYGIKIGIAEDYRQLFFNSMMDNIAILIEQKESRKAELLRDAKAAAERVAREAAERRKKQQEFEEYESQRRLEITAGQKLEAQFDTLAKPIETPELSKGTQVKRKYKVTSIGGHSMIMRWWATNIMPGMSVEELNKKLSFMRTAADKALNQGDAIEGGGLEIVEDISTRSSKSFE
jgi:hypothetical protein